MKTMTDRERFSSGLIAAVLDTAQLNPWSRMLLHMANDALTRYGLFKDSAWLEDFRRFRDETHNEEELETWLAEIAKKHRKKIGRKKAQ